VLCNVVIFFILALCFSTSWGTEFSCLNAYASINNGKITTKDLFPFLDDKKSFDISQLKTSESTFAFLEAVAIKNNIAIVDFKKLLFADSEHRAHSTQLLAKLTPGKPLNQARLKEILFEIYLLSRTIQLGTYEKSWFQRKLKNIQFKESLRQKVESEIFIDEIIAGVENYTELPPNSFIQKFFDASKKNTFAVESTYTLLLNYLSLKFLSTVGYLPGFSDRLTGRLPPVIRNEIKSGNYNEQEQNVESITSGHHGLHRLWKVIRLTYSAAFILQTAAVLAPASPAIKAAAGAFAVEPKIAAAHQEKDFSADKVRHEQFESWRQSFYRSEKRWPDPIIDAVEWNETHESIYGSSAEELKAKY
jgi:hypothetical protein